MSEQARKILEREVQKHAIDPIVLDKYHRMKPGEVIQGLPAEERKILEDLKSEDVQIQLPPLWVEP